MKSRFFRWIRYWMGLERATGRRVGRKRLAVEMLEDRVTPSVNWVGANADWNASVNNWLDTADNSHHLPTTGNDVRIENDATVSFNTTVELNTLTLSAASSLGIGSGTLTIDNDSTLDGSVTIVGGAVNIGDAATDVVNVASFAMSGGTLGGPGTLNITTACNWTGGIMQGPGEPPAPGGTTHVASNATLTLSGSSGKVLNGRTLVNDGAATLSGSVLDVRNSALIDNNGVCNVTDIGFIQELIGGTSTFRNDGTFNKSGDGTTTTIRNGLAFLNNGTVNVDAGTLELPSGTSTTGTFAIDGGTTLIFAGTYTMDAASSVSGAGAVQFTVGPVTVNGAYAITGVTTVSGTVAFNTATSLTTLDLSGTLTGTGHVTVGTALNWTSGTMSGNGTTTVAGTATFTLSGNSSKFLSSRTLVNDGAATLSGGILEVRSSAVIDNNGVLNVTDITDIREFDGASTFRNDGTFNKSGAGTTTTIGNGLSFTNNGTVNVSSGTFDAGAHFTNFFTDVPSATPTLTGGIYNIAGTFRFTGANIVTNAATIVLDGANSSFTNIAGLAVNNGNFTIQNGRNFNPSGTFTNAGLVNIGPNSTFTLTNGGTSTGDWDIAATGTLLFSGTTASYLLDGGTDITGDGVANVTVGSNPVNVGDAADDVVNINNLTINEGAVNDIGALHITNALVLGTFNDGVSLQGTGEVTIDGLFTWHAGTMNGSGATVAKGGINFTGNVTLDGRQLDNAGTATWTAGSQILFEHGAVFNNGSVSNHNAVFDAQVNGSISHSVGNAPAFNNFGTFKKTGDSGNAITILVPFNNNGGTVDVQVGTLTLRADGTSTGPWTVAAAAILDFASGTWNLNAGSTVSGAGIGRFEFAVVNFADSYTVDHTEFPFDGIVNFNANSSTKTLALNTGTLGGSGDFTVADSLTWGSGRMTGAGTTFVNGDLTLNSGFPGLIGRRVDNNGTATWTGNSLSFSNGAVFNNNGTFDDQIDNSINDGGGAQSLFNNNGTFRKSVLSGTTNILVAFTNNGTIDVQTGVLSLNGPSGGLTNFPIASTATIEPTGATESGTTVTITTGGHQFLVVGQTVTISGVGEAGYNGTFTVTAVPSQLTFQYTAATSGLPDSGGGSATFLSDSTLTGGTYLISGTFQFTGANVVTNAANIVLDGPASAFLNQFPSANALANFASNAAGGSFTIQNDRNFTTSGAFSNAGTVTANVGTSFAVAAGNNYTQTGGTTTVSGSLSADAVNINGGLLKGTGIVNGALVNAGHVAAGNSPGALTVNGSYTQLPAGALDVEIAGTDATDFDRLVIAGAATLGGTINVTELGGFQPALNNVFQVLTFGSVSGDFAVKNGFALGNALAFGEQFNPTNLTLVVGKAQLSYQVQPPAIAISGQPFQVKILVSDANGVPLLTDNVDQVTLTLNQNTFHGGGTSVTQPVVNGVATFNLTIDQGAGGYVLTTGGNGFVDVASSAFDVHQAPAFTSTDHATFTVGSSGTLTVQTTGFPAASLSIGSFSLPSGVTFVDNGNGTATLSGTPTGNVGGVYTVTITAHNGIGSDATQTFTLTVDQAPAITSADNTAFTSGAPGTFTVQTTGFPIVSLSIGSFTLPSGVTFVDNGNGAATLSGTPALGTEGVYHFSITASNGIGSTAVQNFTLIVNGLAIVSADHATFSETSAGSFTVLTTGFPNPTLSAGAFVFPADLSFVDNGNGTATISGTPVSGTHGIYHFTLTAHDGVHPDAAQNFTLTVTAPPVAPQITSTNHATFTVNSLGNFDVITTGIPAPALSIGNFNLPSGVTFTDNADGTATLGGVPTGNVGGVFSFTITAHNGFGDDATQNFTLTINQPAIIISNDHTAFTVDAPGTFNVATVGFPKPSLSIDGFSLPSGVTFTDNANGTATLAGTPTGNVGGTYTFTITAHNGINADATQTFTLTVNQAAAITSVASTTFTVGTTGSFTVATAGFPKPSLSIDAFTLPNGVNFTDNGNGTATLSGTPTGNVGGVYTFTITAHNGIGSDATQTFTLTVNQAASFTSTDHVTFTVGSFGSFTVTTQGFPTPSLDNGGFLLPTGVTFTDNHDGTATLAGTPTGNVGGLHPFAITAHNGIGSNATQTFTLTVNQPVAITSADHATFIGGAVNSFTVTTVGFPFATLSAASAVLPAGVTFTDNGNGTATLSGTPTGVAGVYPFNLTAANAITPVLTQVFTLTVTAPPRITSANHFAFTVGKFDTFTITASPGVPTATTFKRIGALPTGVTLTGNKNGTATLKGTPAAGKGGVYPISIVASNAGPFSTTQNFTLTVNQAPSFSSAAAATFNIGVNNSFTVSTKGFPAATITPSVPFPGDVTFHDNGNGTATLSGVPTVAGVTTVTLTAGNGILPAATQTFKLTVAQPPVFTSSNLVTFRVGQSNSFTVTTTPGSPAATTLSISGVLPAGVTFIDNKNGTGKLSGTPAAGAYHFTIVARNAVAKSTMGITLTVNQTPGFTSASSAIFTMGQTGAFTIKTKGFPTASLTHGPLPAGISFLDNGNGTATLQGAATSAGVFNISLTADNGILPAATQNFKLTVNQPPTFTSAANFNMVVGQTSTFNFTTSPGNPAATTLTLTGTLPTGVTFADNKNGTAKLTGKPAAGKGGVYHFTVTASNAAPAKTTQAFTLTVNQAPAITSAAAAVFSLNQPGSFTIKTTGFPTAAITHGALPAGINFTDNGSGTATLSGTPTVSGLFNFNINADNGVLPVATQAFKLTVNQPPVFTSDPSATFPVNTTGSATITIAPGVPATTTFTMTGALPTGVVFTDKKNGAATLSGKPAAGTGGVYHITITATNGASSKAQQSFTLNVNQAPAIFSVNKATFSVAQSGAFTIKTKGFPFAAIGLAGLPAGLTRADNGNGTATVSGTPLAGTAGVYHLTITATNSVSNATQAFTLTVNQPPIVTSDPSTTFTRNVVNTFTFTASGVPVAKFRLIGTLPAGLAFISNANGTATLKGKPTAAGHFVFTISVTNGALPVAFQLFDLIVT